MPIKDLIDGNKATITVFVNDDGEVTVQEFIDGLTAQEKKGIIQVLNRFAQFGVIYDEQRFRNEGDGVYVFKYNQVRLCCFFQPNTRPKTVILTHGFKKKSQKMDPAEKNRTLRIYKILVRENSI